MRHILILFSVLFLLPGIRAQNQPRCGFLEAQEYLLQNEPGAKQRILNAIEGFSGDSLAAHKSTQVLYTIPVVFHIIHLGGPENISDAQIQSAIDILNRDFNKLNPDTANIVAPFQSLAADCQIEFKLATLDENGNCSTGITRHYESEADWIISPSYYKYTWNRSRYLNIYVVRSLPSGIAAYTFLPNTSSATMDAIVSLHYYVGDIGTGSPFGSRTLTHEVGHWFNLQHTWGSNNQPGVACGDDGVGDTPLTKGFSFCNLANADVCVSGVEENVQNYMEYAFCSNMFTLGQRNRMHNALNSFNAGRNNLWSPANLQSTGVFAFPQTCPPKADFSVNRFFACTGDSVEFVDQSYQAPVTAWQWSSAQAANSSSLQNGILLFNQSGAATVQLKVAGSAGTDSISRQALMVLAGPNSGSASLQQGFESGNFPDPLWLRSEPEFGSAFNSYSLSAHSGIHCLWVNNFFDNPSESVSFYSPAYKFQALAPSMLTFYYAYAQKGPGSNDELKVEASADCGANWNTLLIMQGPALATVPGYSSTAFFPASLQYSLAAVSLNALANQEFHLRFTFSPDKDDPGNNVFIDDILLSGLTKLSDYWPEQKIRVYPNPASGMIRLEGMEECTLVKLSLTDLLGKVYLQSEYAAPAYQIRLPEELKSGLYLLSIEACGSIHSTKLIIGD